MEVHDGFSAWVGVGSVTSMHAIIIATNTNIITRSDDDDDACACCRVVVQVQLFSVREGGSGWLLDEEDVRCICICMVVMVGSRHARTHKRTTIEPDAQHTQRVTKLVDVQVLGDSGSIGDRYDWGLWS